MPNALRMPGRGRVQFSYRQPATWPWRWMGLTTSRVASYEGSIDEDGRPHGYGTWQDSAPRGENLQVGNGLPS